MYESFYGLKEKPFSMLPDPGFLYLSKKHQVALTLLEYGLMNNVGFCVVSGETGSGKTTLLRKLLENIEDNITVGMITNTHKGFGELLDWILSAFDIHEQGMSTIDMHQRFTDFLVEQYAANKSTLLIVDEAQNMTIDKLEELRMLSNVNSEKDHVLQVILAGQPSLKETLRLPELMQFAQRIGVDNHLGSLNDEDTYGYINHRLSVAGATQEIFTEEACDRIYQYSGGTPRLINLLCDTVMVYGFADQREIIDEDLVDEMVQERMQDSIVPLASVTPSNKKKTKKKTVKKKKKKKKKPVSKKVELAEDIPAEEHQPQSNVDSEPDDTRAVIGAMESATAKEKPVTTEDNKDIYEEAVESIEQMASELAVADAAVKDTTESEVPQQKAQEEAEGDIRRREPNTIQVLEPEIVPDTKNWKWAAVVAGLLVISVLIFVVGTSDPDETEKKAASVNQPAPVAEVPDYIKRQLEEAEEFRKELARRQEEDRARMQALEEQAAVLQRERDEALAKVEAEQKKRAKQAAISKRSVRKEKQARADAKKALAKEKEAQLVVKIRAEEAAKLEAELLRQRAQKAEEALKAEQAAQAAAKAAAKPPPVVEAKKKDDSFNTDPCASSTARFLSTCR